MIKPLKLLIFALLVSTYSIPTAEAGLVFGDGSANRALGDNYPYVGWVEGPIHLGLRHLGKASC